MTTRNSSVLPEMYSSIDEVEQNLQQQSSSRASSVRDNRFASDSAARVHSTGMTQKQPHLFLHFDVNETILIGDPAGGDTVTECLNKIIAKSAFVSTDIGTDVRKTNACGVTNDSIEPRQERIPSPSSHSVTTSSSHNLIPTHWWNGQSIEQSSLEAPPLYTGWTWPPNTCPYYRTSYKNLAKTFTQGHGRVYRPFYEALCDKLGLDHNSDSNCCRTGDESLLANFVPAFFHTLQYYFPSRSSDVQTTQPSNGYLPRPAKVTLVLRTFGTDLPRVVRCISEFAKGNHPDFPDYYNPDLILEGDLFCSSWVLRDVHGNTVEGDDVPNMEKAELVYELHTTTADRAGEHSQHRIEKGDRCGDDAILDYLQTKTIVGIQDCYPFWSANNYAPWAGKPVWAKTNTNSFSRKEHHHILLDDNIHNDPNDGAGGIRVPKGLEGKIVDWHTSYESLNGDDALNMQGKHLIRVPTVCPLMQDDWFIQKIEDARYKYFEEDLKDKLFDVSFSGSELVLADKNLTDADFQQKLQWPLNVRHIDLSRNSLKCIPNQVFSCSVLSYLDISRNSLRAISSEIVCLPNLVKLIALSNHLRLRQISLDGLKSLKQLRLLDLRYNRKLKQAALDILKETLLPSNSQLEILCTVPSLAPATEKKQSACDRDATLLQSQLEPISTPQLCKRLERTFGIILDKQSERAYDRDYVMKALLRCYEEHGPRKVRKEQGIPVSPDRYASLLCELEAVPWPRTTRERPKIRAEYYMILQKPGSGKIDSVRTKNETAKLMRYKRLFDLAVATLAEVDSAFADRFTALAVTKNFVGSPHIDTLNVGPFYGMSLGKFTGGAIAVECDPLLVAEVETKGRLGKVDGRFPHWVTPYYGDRYSLIYYVTSGTVEPQTTAIFDLGNNTDWIPPPIFVP